MAATSASAGVCVGACGVLGANGDVIAPPGGGTYSWVSTAGGVTGAGQIGAVGGTDGSSLTSSAFTASAGQVLQYNFNFVTSDGQNGRGNFIYEDYGFVQLLNASTDKVVATLFTARTEPSGTIAPGQGLPPVDPGVTLSPSDVPITLGSGTGVGTSTGYAGGPVWDPLGSFSGQCWGAGCGLTGWIGSTFTLTTGGSYKVRFGVSNWGDTVYDTGLAVSGLTIGGTQIEDNPTVQGGVPEPAAWTMMLAGVSLLGAVLRRRRRTLAA